MYTFSVERPWWVPGHFAEVRVDFPAGWDILFHFSVLKKYIYYRLDKYNIGMQITCFFSRKA
jgi:hypothetical protein